MDFPAVRTMAMECPGAVETLSRGVHSFTVRGKLFLRLLRDGRTLALRTDHFERAHLLAAAPEDFHLTDRLRDHPWVLADLARVDPARMRPLVHDAWRRAAPVHLVESFDPG